MKKILFVFGTRPEGIKLAPLIHEFEGRPNIFETRICITAQHRDMLDQVLDFFQITPHFDLDLMKPNQNLITLTSEIILGLRDVFEEYRPDFVVVHGDTTTSMAASLAAFYSGISVCHVEAGLRTNNKLLPFPEEINRQITARISDFHFAPTINAKMNLLQENIQESKILVTGNTVIDALFYSLEKINSNISDEIISLEKILDKSQKIVLVTGHRRENHGEGLKNICKAIKQLTIDNDDIQIVFPVHMNPNVRQTIFNLLGDIKNILLIDPLGYPAFIWLMSKAYLILTDSGGIQEEAPSLGKPVLVLRDNTERPEAVEAGTVILVGTNPDKIVKEANLLLQNKEVYSNISEKNNPYGDGKASNRIIEFIQNL